MSHPAFYLPDGDRFVPTPACIGPWDAGLQHGGPPSALLAGAAERFGDEAEAFVTVRVTVELLRPLPLAPLSVEVEPLRQGRQARWLRASLHVGGKLGAVATVVRVRRAELHLPDARSLPEPPPTPPEGGTSLDFPFFPVDDAYHRAIDMRVVEGRWGAGRPCTAWLRPRLPLVAGAEASPLERAVIVADATNGVAPALHTRDFGFVNPDLTLALQRDLTGLWLGLRARSVPEASGTGLVQAAVFDGDGEVGRCLQTLVVRPR